jgi:hypothetical protein
MPYSDRKTRLKYQRERRKRLRKAGLCVMCGIRPASLFSGCENCRTKSNKLVKKIIQKNLKSGKCQCGQTRLRNKCVCRRCASYSKTRQKALKLKVIDGYGGQCACCGEKQWKFLCVDHVNNDGAKLRKERGRAETSTTLYRRLIKENFPPEYQILCYNCNMALGFFGCCPHNPRICRTVKRT